MSFLEFACRKAIERVDRGYYNVEFLERKSRRSLKECLRDDVCLVCELKPRSPSIGKIRDIDNPLSLVMQMVNGGADAISILTDPDNFGGSMKMLIEISKHVPKPILMKDFIVSHKQIEAAYRAGASAILLIYPAFKRGYTYMDLESAIDFAHKLGLDVILESYELKDFLDSMHYDADLIGVNSRNLDTLEVNLYTAMEIIRSSPGYLRERILLESGIKSVHDVSMFLKEGVNKFLVGTAIMTAEDVRSKIVELKGAGRWFG